MKQDEPNDNPGYLGMYLSVLPALSSESELKKMRNCRWISNQYTTPPFYLKRIIRKGISNLTNDGNKKNIDSK